MYEIYALDVLGYSYSCGGLEYGLMDNIAWCRRQTAHRGTRYSVVRVADCHTVWSITIA